MAITDTVPALPSRRRDVRLADRYALRTELGDEADITRLGNKLTRRGFDPATTTGSADDALAHIAGKGARGGKEASRLQTIRDRNSNLAEVDTWGDYARTSGIDDIGGQYDSLRQNLQASLAGMDPNSPAVQSIMAGMVEKRGEDTSRYLDEVGQRQSQARIGINTASGMQLSSVLDETGALVESLKMLREQKSQLADAQRGSIFGSLMGPFGGAIGGGITGGRTGSMAGQQAGWDTFSKAMAAMSMFTGRGAGGGGSSTTLKDAGAMPDETSGWRTPQGNAMGNHQLPFNSSVQ